MSGDITTCLWFDTEGEEAAELYCSLIPRSRVHRTTPYADGTERAGQVMTVEFELDGRPYIALNGGPQLTFTEAVSFMVSCADQDEVDHYWDALVADGGEEGPCGWLKDKYGLSWQIVPDVLLELTRGADREAAARVTQAMYRMKKLVIADLEAAAAG
jgi:predicted 3-demethylubiquinone-9 3-methyltransferase (glyoxalase superfamily)